MTKSACENWKDFLASWEIDIVIFPFRWGFEYWWMPFRGLCCGFQVGPVHFELEFFNPWAREFKQKETE